MRRYLDSFTLRDWAFLLGALALVGFLQFDKPAPDVAAPALDALPYSPPGLPQDAIHMPPRAALPAALPADRPAIYGEAGVVRIAPEAGPPTQDQRAGIEQRLRDQRYFGSYAVSPSGAYGWASGYGNLETARQIALGYCAENAEPGEACHTLADLLPEDLTGPAPRHTLNFGQAQGFRAIAAASGPRAYARALDGTSWASDGTSVEDAEAKALAECRRLQASSGGLPEFPCEVIARWTQ